MAKIKSKASTDAEPLAAAPDEFQTLTAKAIDAARPHARTIAIGVVVLGVAVGGLSIWGWMRDRKAAAATLEFGKVLDVATANVEEGGIDPIVLMGSEPEPAKFKTFKERAEAQLTAVQALNNAAGGTGVAARAHFVTAGALYDLGKYDDAIAAHKAFIGSSPGVDFEAMAREGIGYALEAKALAQTDAAARNAGLDEALAGYAAIDPDEKGAYRGLALFHQARIKALKGDKAGAIALYKKVLEDPTTHLKDEATSRLALLETPAQ